MWVVGDFKCVQINPVTCTLETAYAQRRMVIVNASSYLPIEKLPACCRKSLPPDRLAVSEFRPTVSKCSENVAKHPKFYFATICNEGCCHCQLHLLGNCGMM